MVIETSKYNEIKSKLPPSTTVNPYFDSRVLLVAASLNGGNVLESFIDAFLNWNADLGLVQKESVNRDLIWARLIDLAEKAVEVGTSLNCEPKIFAERHDKQTFGSMSNISHENVDSIGLVFDSICRGLIRNLREMITVMLMSELGCRRILATGSALVRNKRMKKWLEVEFADFEIVYKASSDSAMGAVSFAKDTCI
jgi:sedoheptulokinase